MLSHMRTHAHAKKADGDIWKDGASRQRKNEGMKMETQ